MSNRLAMLAASPRSPLAFSLPVMNSVTGLALPVTTLRKSTEPRLSASFGSCSGFGDSAQAPSAMTSSYVSAPPSGRSPTIQWMTALVEPARPDASVPERGEAARADGVGRGGRPVRGAAGHGARARRIRRAPDRRGVLAPASTAGGAAGPRRRGRRLGQRGQRPAGTGLVPTAAARSSHGLAADRAPARNRRGRGTAAAGRPARRPAG